jgi:DNA polymerase
MTRIFIDFETYSSVDLKKCGAHRYFESPDADVLCAAWATHDGVVQSWVPGQPAPQFPYYAVFSSWNAGFERLAWPILHARYGWPAMPPIDKWTCSMGVARQFGCPGGLDKAAMYLGVPVRKDYKGMALIRRWCIPNANGERRSRESDPAGFVELVAYCAQDVRVERAVVQALPRSGFMAHEARNWQLDQRINERGVAVDQAQAARVVEAASIWQAQLEGEAKRLTGGLVSTQRDAILTWLRAQEGADDLQSLARADVEEVLPALEGDAKRVAEIRLALSRSSVAKYAAILRTVGGDGRVRGMFTYHGAHTGRWSGSKIQLQNIPRLDHSLYAGAMNIGAGALQLLGEEPMEVYSGMIRSTLVAPPGKTLVIGDLSQIELVVNAWLAGQHDVLEAFRRGDDIYKLKAVEFFGLRDVGEVTKRLRQIAKSAVLGAQFQMGPARFRDYTRDTTGIDMPMHEAERVIGAYRESVPAITRFWRALRDAMIEAANRPGVEVPVGEHLSFYRRGEWLVIRLPSGRGLYYRKPRVVGEGWRANIVCSDGRFGDQRYFGGLLCENVVQATARDVLVEGMHRIEEHRLPIVLHAHDEAVAEAELAEAEQAVATMKELMERPIPWAVGLPLRAEVGASSRYRK